MKTPLKYTIDVEMMYCPKCEHISAHTLTGNYWTCLDCGHQLGKKLSRYRRFLNKIFA